MAKQTILVGMSGGVDSSLTALLLKKEGYNVLGAYMNVWNEADRAKLPADSVISKRESCYGPDAEAEMEEVKAIAQRIGIPLHIFNVSHEYSSCVLNYFVKEYSEGRTPNPCVECNQNIKFGALMDKARAEGLSFDLFATGHYVKLGFDEISGRHYIQRASDRKKDQSYFLYGLRQHQLKNCLFPLGGFIKKDVKRLASEFGLGLEEKPESQNFINGDYTFLFPEKPIPGDFVDLKGNVLGKHRGIIYYTIGQRKGIGIAAKDPLYVVAIDQARNQVIVGGESDLYTAQCSVSRLNWQKIEALTSPCQVQVKIRYASDLEKAIIEPKGQNQVQVIFESPARAVTPGQSVVFYDNDDVLGGGIIS